VLDRRRAVIFLVGDMVQVDTGHPRNYELSFIGRIEDIRTDIPPEDRLLPSREVHRFGIRMPHGVIYYFSEAEIFRLKKPYKS
jgi:hypothetical protein